MPVSKREVRAAARRIVASPEWEHATRLARFLEFVVEQTAAGKGDTITDREIGKVVFGRGADYDPKADNVVRTEARRLRTKLEEYYQGSGATDPVHIELPRGEYTPVFTHSGAPQPPMQLPQFHIPWRAAVGLAVATALAGAAYLARDVRMPHLGSDVTGSARSLTRNVGVARTPAISPDASRIAYSIETGIAYSTIFVQELHSTARAISFGNVLDVDPAWAPDGVHLAFLRRKSQGRYSLILQDATKYTDTGRTLTELSARAGLDWSADGKSIIVGDKESADTPTSLQRIDIATGTRIAITEALADSDPRTSPDGQWIAFVRAQHKLLVMPAAGGPLREIETDSRRFQGLTWAPDSKSIVASAERANEVRALWRYPLQGGEPIRVPDTGYAPNWPAMPKRAPGLAFVVKLNDSNLWGLNTADRSSARQLTASDQIDSSPELSPDGKQLAWRSTRGGSSEIWIANADGSRARQLTSMHGPATGNPAWSPDSGSILFESRAKGNADIYTIAVSGGPARALVSTPANEVVPRFSRDGRSLIYSTDRNGAWELVRRDLGTTKETVLAGDGAFAGVESYDGHQIYFTRQGQEIGGIWVKPAHGGKEELLVGELPSKLWGQWALSKDALFYAVFPGAGTQAIRRVDLNTRKVTDVASLQRAPLAQDAGMTVNASGTSLIWSQMDQSGSDVYWVDRFR